MTTGTSAYESSPRFGAVKHDVATEIGEKALVLPTLVNRALEANDRAKYLLSLFQAARAHADDPERPFPTLRDERLSAGLPDSHLDDVVRESRRTGADSYQVPSAGALLGSLHSSIAEMLIPLSADPGLDQLTEARLDALVQAAPEPCEDCLSGSFIEHMASTDRALGDSYHLLVMDAHRALNRLQTEIATESLDGASVYHLAEDDPPLVTVFMTGVHSTAPLNFDHPGLGTTATRSGRRLLIQNDIGETAAHLIVVSVENLTVSITYTDDHVQRLRFFQAILDRYDIQWSGIEGRTGGVSLGAHDLVTGRYTAPDASTLLEFLEFLGSRWYSSSTGTVPASAWLRSSARRMPWLCSAGQATRTVDTWRSSSWEASASYTTQSNWLRRSQLATGSHCATFSGLPPPWRSSDLPCGRLPMESRPASPNNSFATSSVWSCSTTCMRRTPDCSRRRLIMPP